jgi:hypothetical protein
MNSNQNIDTASAASLKPPAEAPIVPVCDTWDEDMGHLLAALEIILGRAIN